MNRRRMAKLSFCSHFLSTPNRNISIWDYSCFHKAIMKCRMPLAGLGHPMCKALIYNIVAFLKRHRKTLLSRISNLWLFFSCEVVSYVASLLIVPAHDSQRKKSLSHMFYTESIIVSYSSQEVMHMAVKIWMDDFNRTISCAGTNNHPCQSHASQQLLIRKESPFTDSLYNSTCCYLEVSPSQSVVSLLFSKSPFEQVFMKIPQTKQQLWVMSRIFPILSKSSISTIVLLSRVV